MRKKIVSIVLVAVMLITMACVGAITTSAADTIGKIYFQMPQQWIDDIGNKAVYVFAHIWVNGGGSYSAWQQDDEKMTDLGNGLYEFNIAKLPEKAEDGSQPQWDMVIFTYAGRGISAQSYDTTLYPECINKTFTLDTDAYLENPVDSSKKGPAAYCEGTPSGPHLVLSSLGNLVPDPEKDLRPDGSVIKGSLLPGETAEQVIENFVSSKIDAYKKAHANPTDEELAQCEAEARQFIADNHLEEKVQAAIATDPQDPTDEQPTDDTSAPATDAPSGAPTDPPTQAPTEAPTDAPTEAPTEAPTDESTEPPTDAYGRNKGIPMPDGMILNTSKDSDPNRPDWDGLYRIYYFVAPDEWLDPAIAGYKNEGFEIGFYWFYGGTDDPNTPWPGEPATNLVDYKVNYYKEMHPSATEEEINEFTAEAEATCANVYFAVVRSDANAIVWNNGIDAGLPTDEGYSEVKAAAASQTEDIKVQDAMFNVLGSKDVVPDDVYDSDEYYDDPLYNDDYPTGVTDLCGCITYVRGWQEQENPLTGLIKKNALVNWKFFDPKTGERTNQGLVDESGNLVLNENDEAQNPYYDMDYTYIPPEGTPVEIPTSPDTPGTEDPSGATNPAGGSGGGSSNAPANGNGGNSNAGTVNTSENTAVISIIVALLIGTLGVAFFARKRKETTDK